MVGIMIQTAFLVITILAVQKIFGAKLHAYVRYGLWLLVVLRLLIPANFIDSPFSMLQVAETIRLSNAARESADLQRSDSVEQADVLKEQEASLENILQSASVGIDAEKVSSIENTENTVADSAAIGTSDSGQADATLRTDDANRKENDTARRIDMKRIHGAITEAYLSGTINKVWSGIWLTGSLLVGGFLGFSHFRFRRRLRRTRVVYKKGLPRIIKKTQVPVYRVKGLESACLVGLVRPAVYIGTNIDTVSDHFRYAVTHEEVHYLHRDYIWALVRAVLVTVYWFHPFVWIAAAYSVKDGEIACDYGTIRRLGKEERFAYVEMLLALSQIRKGKRIYSYGTMLRPGKSELKERIMRLTQKNGSRVWAGVLAAFIMIIAAGCVFTGASEVNGDKVFLLVNEAGKDSADTATDDNGNAATDNEVAQGGNGESNGSESLPDNEDADMIEPQQLEAKPAEVSEDTPFGVDGPHLDYAGWMVTSDDITFIFHDIIIFHDYFGLIVYDLGNEEIMRSLDLASIGCDMTQGDDACQVAVSEDGATVWLHPMSKRYMYRYEVETNQLYQEPLVKTFELDLEAEELFDRYLNLSMEPEYTDEYTNWSWHSNYLYEQYKDEQGLHNAYIYLWASNNSDINDMVDSKLKLRNLECIWDDMVFTLFNYDANVKGNADNVRKDVNVQDDATAESDADLQNDAEVQLIQDNAASQDNQAGETSETANTDGFPYRYDGGVEDIAIIYDEPCNYTRISDVFGVRRHPVTGEIRVHDGIDFAAAEGTDITAAADGVVFKTGYSAEHGNYVVLLHVNGDMTYYCHCQGVTVNKDNQVKRGDKIATVGSSGRSTGPHLHFALSKDGAFVNPQNYMEDTFSYGMN